MLLRRLYFPAGPPDQGLQDPNGAPVSGAALHVEAVGMYGGRSLPARPAKGPKMVYLIPRYARH